MLPRQPVFTSSPDVERHVTKDPDVYAATVISLVTVCFSSHLLLHIAGLKNNLIRLKSTLSTFSKTCIIFSKVTACHSLLLQQLQGLKRSVHTYKLKVTGSVIDTILIWKLEIRYTVYKNSLLTLVGGVCLSQPPVLSQRSGKLRVVCSILAVPSTVLFWTGSSDVVLRICLSPSSSLGVTAPRAPTVQPLGQLWPSLPTSSLHPLSGPGTSSTSHTPFPDRPITWNSHPYQHCLLLLIIYYHNVRQLVSQHLPVL